MIDMTPDSAGKPKPLAQQTTIGDSFSQRIFESNRVNSKEAKDYCNKITERSFFIKQTTSKSSLRENSIAVLNQTVLTRKKNKNKKKVRKKNQTEEIYE